MANCSPIKIKPSRICIGDLRDRIFVYVRSITTPASNGVDFNESFTNPIIAYAMIETVNGETVFDATNTEKIVTHNFYIRTIPGLTSEAWIEFRHEYYDILTIENINEFNRFMLVKVSFRGTVLKPVNFA